MLLVLCPMDDQTVSVERCVTCPMCRKGHLRMDEGALGLALEEHTPVPAALAHMARHRARRVPVVNGDGVVIGVLEDLDAMRALRGVPPE